MRQDGQGEEQSIRADTEKASVNELKEHVAPAHADDAQAHVARAATLTLVCATTRRRPPPRARAFSAHPSTSATCVLLRGQNARARHP